jgi:multiple sugar transport system substrate-binding protein
MTHRVLRLSALLVGSALFLGACGEGFESGEAAAPSEATDASTAPAASGDTDASAPASGAADTGADITVLIGSSGEAETAAVEDLVAQWSEESGTNAEVRVASDLVQELAQGFSSNEPPDLFYLSTDQMYAYAAQDALEPYAENLSNADDFSPALREAFTVDGEFMCAPKDFSTLALIINSDMWTEAGLTDEDIPTTWDELSAVAEQLTTDEVVGLAFGPEVQRVGVFMAQAGGAFVEEDGETAVVNSPENEEALQYVKDQMAAGTFKYSSDVGAGWGGEAFGNGLAAMVIEGNWIKGAMDNDFPDVNYTVAELPEGPAGPGTIQYTNCWGMAAQSDNIPGATSLVEHLTSPEAQLQAAEAFGVMPSAESAFEEWSTTYPELAAFISGAEYAINLPAQPGTPDVIADFNAQLATLTSSEPATILESVNSSLQAALDAQ